MERGVPETGKKEVVCVGSEVCQEKIKLLVREAICAHKIGKRVFFLESFDIRFRHTNNSQSVLYTTFK